MVARIGRRGFVGGAAALVRRPVAAAAGPRRHRDGLRRGPPSAVARHLRRDAGRDPRRRGAWTTPRAVDRLLGSVRRQRADAGAGLDQPRVRPSCAAGAGRRRPRRRTGVDGKPLQHRAPGPGAGARAAQLVGRGDAGHRPAAGRAHGAVLAQPFHLLAREGAVRAGAVPPERAVPPRGARQLRAGC